MGSVGMNNNIYPQRIAPFQFIPAPEGGMQLIPTFQYDFEQNGAQHYQYGGPSGNCPQNYNNNRRRFSNRGWHQNGFGNNGNRCTNNYLSRNIPSERQEIEKMFIGGSEDQTKLRQSVAMTFSYSWGLPTITKAMLDEKNFLLTSPDFYLGTDYQIRSRIIVMKKKEPDSPEEKIHFSWEVLSMDVQGSVQIGHRTFYFTKVTEMPVPNNRPSVSVGCSLVPCTASMTLPLGAVRLVREDLDDDSVINLTEIDPPTEHEKAWTFILQKSQTENSPLTCHLEGQATFELPGKVPGDKLGGDVIIPPPVKFSEMLLLSENYADVTLRIIEDNIELPAHRAILASASPVFDAMFSHCDMKESQLRIVDIPDLSAEAMRAVLYSIYSDKRPVDIANELYAELLYAADKYELNRLKAFCEEKLSTMLWIGNMLDMFILADTHNATQLKHRALNFICIYPQLVVKGEAWRQKKGDLHPKLLLELLEAIAKASTPKITPMDCL